MNSPFVPDKLIVVDDRDNGVQRRRRGLPLSLVSHPAAITGSDLPVVLPIYRPSVVLHICTLVAASITGRHGSCLSKLVECQRTDEHQPDLLQLVMKVEVFRHILGRSP